METGSLACMMRCGDWMGLRRVNKPESPIGAMVTGQVSRFLAQKPPLNMQLLFPLGSLAPQQPPKLTQRKIRRIGLQKSILAGESQSPSISGIKTSLP